MHLMYCMQNIPEEYRKYIPKKYRPGNKKVG
jgi:hypothetical protein